MAQTFRTTKLEKFINKQVEHMKIRQDAMNSLKKEGASMETKALIKSIEEEVGERWDCISELCEEFDIEMPKF